MAASQDTFGKVYLGFGGNSFVYGQTVAGAALPGQPTGLVATAASNTEVDLSWTSPSTGSVSSYNLYRGTAAGGESATPVATGIAGTSYQDSGLTKGTTYYYQVAAVNTAGVGPGSNESSAIATQPALQLAAATGSQTSVTVNAGQSATFNLVLNSTNFTGAVSFSCTGAPAGDNCSAPSPVTLTPSVAATPVTVTIQTAAATAGLRGSAMPLLVSLTAAILWIPVRRLKRRGAGIGLILLAMIPLALAAGCGSGGGSQTTPPSTTFTLTLTASGTGGLSATQALTVTVP